MTDELVDVVARFRTAALPEVRSPGWAAVRHTVRRRRIAHAATGAGLLAAGLVSALVLPSLGPHPVDQAAQKRLRAEAETVIDRIAGQPAIAESGPLPAADVTTRTAVMKGQYV